MIRLLQTNRTDYKMAKLSKIVLHWSAGTNEASTTDYQHYHYIITGEGLVIQGQYAPEDNINCNDNKYARHCGGGNTGAIGVAFCGCYVPNGVNVKDTKYPLTRVQLERGFKLCAELCKKYNIPIDKTHVFTHYEFGQANPKTSSAGKIDITYMHPFPWICKNDVAPFIRSKIKWYYSNLIS